MIIEMLTQCETLNEGKAPQCGLLRVFVRKRKCRRGTARRIAKGLETAIAFFLLFKEKVGYERLVFSFNKIREKGFRVA